MTKSNAVPMRRNRGLNKVIALVFMLSGFAAMTYQIIWQRALYAIFGINIESVTVVVTAFLLGLGFGSLLGGVLSKSGKYLLQIFAVAEIAIGVYGLLSLSLFHWLGSAGAGLPAVVSSLFTFALLLPPTLLMGMTLPLLVAEGVERSRTTGHTVSDLYFVNTAGSAAAALFSVAILMPLLGERGSVRLAAAINVGIGLYVLNSIRRGTRP